MACARRAEAVGREKDDDCRGCSLMPAGPHWDVVDRYGPYVYFRVISCRSRLWDGVPVEDDVFSTSAGLDAVFCRWDTVPFGIEGVDAFGGE